MKNRLILAIALFLSGALLLLSQLPAAASPSYQAAVPSPTPGPDGQIIYIVKAGDTCMMIANWFGISVEYLRTQNMLNENCDLREGKRLMLGVGGPSIASPTPGPSPTPTVPAPTPTLEVGGTASVCVLVYNDLNGDALRQETEGAVPGAAISLTSLAGTFSKTLTTVINPDATAYQGTCFTNVPAGKYTISAAVPDGYNPTIALASSLEIVPGDTAYFDFGAQPKTATTTVTSKKASPWLGILGALFLLGGIGLGGYVVWWMRKK